MSSRIHYHMLSETYMSRPESHEVHTTTKPIAKEPGTHKHSVQIPIRPSASQTEESLRIARETLFSMPVPHAPRSGMDHGIVRRVVGKYYAPGASPRTAYIHLSQESPRPKPSHWKQRKSHQNIRQVVPNKGISNRKKAGKSTHTTKYTHKHRKLHVSSGHDKHTRKKTEVAGAKLYAFADRPEVLTAAHEITRTNDRMARQLNRLSEKRKKLDKKIEKLLGRAHHFAEVEGKALLDDKNARDERIELLSKSLQEMIYKADYAQFQTRQYNRLLRRAKKLAHDQARKVVTLQEDLGKYTDPVGGHVARARNNVVVANQAFDIENKHLHKTREELFKEVREQAAKLSELRQDTTDQRLVIELEEATVFRREKIRKQALLDMAFDENKRLVSRALQTTSKRKVTRRKVLQMSAMLARFERMMSRLKQATGVTGIDAVVRRWFERTEREKALQEEGHQYETNIESYKKVLKSMTEQLSNLQAFGSDISHSRRADRAFDKILGTFDVRSKAASVRLANSSENFHNKRLNLGLVIECVRSLSVRFKLNAEKFALASQLRKMQEYASKEENSALATQLNRCLKSLTEAIGRLMKDLSGKVSNSQSSSREDESTGQKKTSFVRNKNQSKDSQTKDSPKKSKRTSKVPEPEPEPEQESCVATIMDLPIPLGQNVRVQTRRKRRVGDQVSARSMPMQRITKQLLDQVHYNGVKWARVFKSIDTDGSGQIRRSEFAQVLRDLQINVSSSDLELLMERFDQNRDDKLDYEEFLLMVGGKVRASDSADSSDSAAEDEILDALDRTPEEPLKLDSIRRESVPKDALLSNSSDDKYIAGLDKHNARKAAFDLSSMLSKATDIVASDKTKNAEKKKAGNIARGGKKGYSETMQNEIRASNAALIAQRKAKKREIRAKEHERLLKMNIHKAKNALKSGDKRHIRPEGILSRQDLKHWASEVASHGERLRYKRSMRTDSEADDYDTDDELDPRKRRRRQRRGLKGKGKMSLVQRQAESIKEQKTERMRRQEEENVIMQGDGETVAESESDSDSNGISDNADSKRIEDGGDLDNIQGK